MKQDPRCSRSNRLPFRYLVVPVTVEFLIVLRLPVFMGFNHTRSAKGKDGRINGIFNSVIDMATGGNGSTSGDTVDDCIVFTRLADLAADSLGLAMLGQSRGGGEVAKAVDALKLLVVVGGGLEVLDESSGGLNALATGT